MTTRFRCALVLVALLVIVLQSPATSQQLPTSASARSEIHGVVCDSSGKPVSEASVSLALTGSTSIVRTRTHADGVFAFPALAAGSYTLMAEKAVLRSHDIAAIILSVGEQRQVDLTLEDSKTVSAGTRASSSTSTPAMEFADAPNFTIAAVTDWTAAGGHGSDSSLRTSEALTRETLTLKPQTASGDTPNSNSDPHKIAADQHRLAGERAEKMGDPLAAVHEFEQAVREDPSEQNYFDWGSELLLHRAVLQAKDVFAAGTKLYPKSARMLTALGAALFAGAFYDEAALRLCEASDLSPAEPEPYMFMGRIEIAAPNPLACVEQKLARFVELRPENTLANYYYAMAVWKQQGQSIDPQRVQQVETILTKAVNIDPKCGEAYLQLGVLNAGQRNYQKAISFYTKAIDANPRLSEAHYRLGVAYDRVGDREKAKQEFQLHDEIEKQLAATVERQRREVKQFLVVVPDKPSNPPIH